MKLLSKLLTARLSEETDKNIREEQFGFRVGRSTLQAINNLIQDIDDALRHSRGKFYTVFIDYTKAFDKLDRRILIAKLQSLIGNDNPIVTLIHNIVHQFIKGSHPNKRHPTGGPN